MSCECFGFLVFVVLAFVPFLVWRDVWGYCCQVAELLSTSGGTLSWGRGLVVSVSPERFVAGYHGEDVHQAAT